MYNLGQSIGKQLWGRVTATKKSIKFFHIPLPQVAALYDVVINCTGHGAKQLLNDDKCYLIRGQLLRVSKRCPFVWLNTVGFNSA